MSALNFNVSIQLKVKTVSLNICVLLQVRNGQLFDIKENVPHVVLPKRRPLMGLSCSSCTPASRVSLNTTKARNLAFLICKSLQLIISPPSYRLVFLVRGPVPHLKPWNYVGFSFTRKITYVFAKNYSYYQRNMQYIACQVQQSDVLQNYHANL